MLEEGGPAYKCGASALATPVTVMVAQRTSNGSQVIDCGKHWSADGRKGRRSTKQK